MSCTKRNERGVKIESLAIKENVGLPEGTWAKTLFQIQLSGAQAPCMSLSWFQSDLHRISSTDWLKNSRSLINLSINKQLPTIWISFFFGAKKPFSGSSLSVPNVSLMKSITADESMMKTFIPAWIIIHWPNRGKPSTREHFALSETHVHLVAHNKTSREIRNKTVSLHT